MSKKTAITADDLKAALTKKKHRAAQVGETYQITLLLPPRELNPNGRCHWSVKARITKTHREHAFIQSIGTPLKLFANPTVSVVAYCATRRGRDRDNLIAGMKPQLDGLADAGLFTNDKCVRWGDVEFAIDKDNPRVEMTIKEFPRE